MTISADAGREKLGGRSADMGFVERFKKPLTQFLRTWVCDGHTNAVIRFNSSVYEPQIRREPAKCAPHPSAGPVSNSIPKPKFAVRRHSALSWAAIT